MRIQNSDTLDPKSDKVFLNFFSLYFGLSPFLCQGYHMDHVLLSDGDNPPSLNGTLNCVVSHDLRQEMVCQCSWCSLPCHPSSLPYGPPGGMQMKSDDGGYWWRVFFSKGLKKARNSSNNSSSNNNINGNNYNNKTTYISGQMIKVVLDDLIQPYAKRCPWHDLRIYIYKCIYIYVHTITHSLRSVPSGPLFGAKRHKTFLERSRP